MVHCNYTVYIPYLHVELVSAWINGVYDVGIPYPPKNKPSPPPFSASDVAQTGEGAYFQICAMRLEYKPPSSR